MTERCAAQHKSWNSYISKRYSKKNIEKEYVVYYVPASEEATTSLPVPAEGEYTISGDNKNGFIITVEISAE